MLEFIVLEIGRSYGAWVIPKLVGAVDIFSIKYLSLFLIMELFAGSYGAGDKPIQFEGVDIFSIEIIFPCCLIMKLLGGSYGAMFFLHATVSEIGRSYGA